MRKTISAITVLCLVAISPLTAQAATSKQEKIGVGTGAIVGAAAGGPVGLILGAAAGVRYQVHLGIDLLQQLLPANAYRFVVISVNLIIQVFLLVIIYWGFKILGVIKFQTSPSMNIPMIYPYMAVPVGGIFMFINSVRIAVAAFRGRILTREVIL